MISPEVGIGEPRRGCNNENSIFESKEQFYEQNLLKRQKRGLDGKKQRKVTVLSLKDISLTKRMMLLMGIQSWLTLVNDELLRFLELLQKRERDFETELAEQQPHLCTLDQHA
jgi:hypothetical protein